MKSQNLPPPLSWLIISLLLIGCSDGSSISTPQTEVTLTTPNDTIANTNNNKKTVTLSVNSTKAKTFKFNWTKLMNAKHYQLFENPEPYTGFLSITPKITSSTTSYEHVVGFHKHINARYILQSCNSIGECFSSNEVIINNAASSYIKASNHDEYDKFGISITLSSDGKTLVVGADEEDGINNNSTNSGAVYVFTLSSNSSWTETAYIKANNNSDAFDRFGTSVALSSDGKTLVVGADEKNGIANTSINSGAVYVFTLSSNNKWTETAYIKANNPDEYDNFGHSVALSSDGKTLVVGAIRDDGIANTSINSGAVYVFTLSSNNKWTETAPILLEASNHDNNDNFGYSVALSSDGKTLVVGADGEDGITNTSTNSGSVYVFTLSSNSSWTETAYIKASNPDEHDRFGTSIALSNDGKTLVVGVSEKDGIGNNSGAVYVFTLSSNSSWTETAYIEASNPDEYDRFGTSVALSSDGKTLVVGAGEEDGINSTNSGAVYVFTLSSNNKWTETAYIKANNNSDAFDRFGTSVALSSDGKTLAVGADGEDGIGNTSTNSGAVYIY